jgi:hypothetical protein
MCFSRCSLKSILIPPSVEILRRKCFENVIIGTLRFCSDCRLSQVDASYFADCFIQRLCIPGSLSVLGEC